MQKQEMGPAKIEDARMHKVCASQASQTHLADISVDGKRNEKYQGKEIYLLRLEIFS